MASCNSPSLLLKYRFRIMKKQMQHGWMSSSQKHSLELFWSIPKQISTDWRTKILNHGNSFLDLIIGLFCHMLLSRNWTNKLRLSWAKINFICWIDYENKTVYMNWQLYAFWWTLIGIFQIYIFDEVLTFVWAF